MATLLISEICAYPICLLTNVANCASLAEGHPAGSEKSRDSDHGLCSSRAWILSPDPAVPLCLEPSSPIAYSGSLSHLEQSVWLLLKATA